jgi:copper resistance protein B|tara:strand:- start:1318 stop:2031 length:714 start_codon:yes stop_codon:yes gene_type:complete
MTLQKILAGLVAPAFVISVLPATPVQAEPLIWGVQAEQTEFRYGKDTDVFAWNFDALVGSDELKLVWRSEGEFATKNDNFERLENQLRAQVPISTFFDAVGGVRFSSPSSGNRFDGVIGLHGLAPQFFEVDADLFVGEYPSARLDVDYEVLLTNRLIATPTIELNLPFTDDTKYGKAAFGPSLEVGLRLSYDVVDRLLSPYIGIHYERSFGGTANIKRSEGEDAGAVFFLVGAKMIF